MGSCRTVALLAASAVALAAAGCSDKTDATGSDCRTNAECPIGQYCGDDDRCTLDCREDSDCASGVCSTLGTCVGGAIDGGLQDGGGGTPDGAVSDGSLDVTDGGGAPDSGEPDARVLDAGPPPPDISGTFLLGISVAIAPSSPFHFLATNSGWVDNGDGTASVDMTLTPLTTTTRTLTTGFDSTSADVVIDSSGHFDADFNDMVIPGSANPISASSLTVSFILHGDISSTDFYCGTVDGTITSPIVLDISGSSFAAVRVPPGTEGDALPPTQTNCP